LGRPLFFDRGVSVVAAYLRLCGMAVPPHIDRAAKLLRYNRRVFVAPPWPEIFRQDAERKEGFAEAAATCQALVATIRITVMSWSRCCWPRSPSGWTRSAP